MLKRILLNNLSLNDINPRVCGIHVCQPDEITPRHHIQRRVLHYVPQGSGAYLINDRSYQVSAGDIFISRPGDVTSYIASHGDPFSYIWVSFDCAPSFDRLLDRLGDRRVLMLGRALAILFALDCAIYGLRLLF